MKYVLQEKEHNENFAEEDAEEGDYEENCEDSEIFQEDYSYELDEKDLGVMKDKVYAEEHFGDNEDEESIKTENRDHIENSKPRE